MIWQRGGQWQTGGILDARCWVMWQSGGCEGSSRLGEVSSTLNVKWHGREEGGSRPGEAFSMLNIKWRGRVEGEGSGRWCWHPCCLRSIGEHFQTWWRVWSLLWGEKEKGEQIWNKPKPTNTNTKSNTNQKHKTHVLECEGRLLGYAQNRSCRDLVS